MKLAIVALLLLQALGQLVKEGNAYVEKTDLLSLAQNEERVLKVGPSAYVNLDFPDHPAQGYEWTFKNMRELKQNRYVGEGHTYPSVPGNPGRRTYVVQAPARGQEELIFINMKDNLLETARHYRIMITVE